MCDNYFKLILIVKDMCFWRFIHVTYEVEKHDRAFSELLLAQLWKHKKSYNFVMLQAPSEWQLLEEFLRPTQNPNFAALFFFFWHRCCGQCIEMQWYFCGVLWFLYKKNIWHICKYTARTKFMTVFQWQSNSSPSQSFFMCGSMFLASVAKSTFFLTWPWLKNIPTAAPRRGFSKETNVNYYQILACL